jgi:hypothetical protein
MIDAFELQMHHADLAVMLTSTCRVLSYEDGDDGDQDWSDTAGGVPCLVGQPSQGAGAEAFGYDGTEPTVTIWLSGDEPLQPGARIRSRNRTYRVVHVPAPHTEELMRGVVCVDVRTPGEAR